MKKGLILAITLALLSQISYAETCPDVSDVKNNKLVGWKFYDSEESTPLSIKRETAFKKEVTAFALAEWASKDQKNSAMHCYYLDKNGSDLEAYLARDHFIPKNSKNWYQVSGFMQCAAGMKNCEFEKNPLQQSTQLARK